MNLKKDRIQDVCPIARRCGGCQHKNLVYNTSLRKKQDTLARLLSPYVTPDKIIPSPSPLHYRNKVQAAFGSIGGKTVSGIYQSSERKLIPCEGCLLEDERADAIVNTIRELCPRFSIRAYDMRRGVGFLRHVLVRVAKNTSEIMVVLVTARGEFKSERSFVNELVRRHPEITTVVHNINDTDTPLFLGGESRTLYGDGYVRDTLCGLSFRISAQSFYQVNTEGAEKLYSLAREYAALTGGERVLDAYCGTGTIGLTLAGAAREVVGVELNSRAVADAENNAKINGIENAAFVCADAGEYMSEAALCGEHFDVVVTDPPRAGCSRKFLSSLVKLAPERIVYVSCNPETLARDLRLLTSDGYKVTRARGVDMFAFTEHVECVVCLTRRLDK